MAADSKKLNATSVSDFVSKVSALEVGTDTF